jgi:hypothetical protein
MLVYLICCQGRFHHSGILVRNAVNMLSLCWSMLFVIEWLFIDVHPRGLPLYQCNCLVLYTCLRGSHNINSVDVILLNAEETMTICAWSVELPVQLIRFKMGDGDDQS